MTDERWAALRDLRIGCVKYLNSRPLICAYDGPVIFEHPSALARDLAAGLLDAALVPIFEILREPVYSVVDHVAIACDGPVYSVILAYRGSLNDVQSIALDPASLTSANLLRVLLAEFHGLHPAFGGDGAARLIIGNQAIEFRMNEEVAGGWTVLDLGEEWKRCTGLPFVFAAWAMRAGIPAAAADALRGLKAEGVAQVAALIDTETFATATIRGDYLAHRIRFDLGDAERAAIAEYRRLLTKHGLIQPSGAALRFV